MSHIRKFYALHKTELLLFLLAFGMRALYALVIQLTVGAHGFISFSDAEFFYYRAAVNLFEHDAFSLAPTAPFHPEAYHTPLYPLFIAAFLWLHLPLITVALAQALFWGAIAVLTYRTALTLSRSHTVGIAAGLLISLEPMSIYWSGLLMSDTLFTGLAVAAIYFLLEEHPYTSLVLLGFAALTRPIALYLMPFFIAMHVYRLLQKKTQAKTIVLSSLLAFLLFAVVVAPWFARNKIVFNTWSFSSANWYLFYGFPLREYSDEWGVAIPDAMPKLPIGEEYQRFDFQYAPQFEKAVLESASVHPLGFLAVYLKRSLYSFVSDRYDYLFHVVFASQAPSLYARLPNFLVNFFLAAGEMFWLCVYALCFAALAVRKLWPWWLFAAVLVGVNTLLSGGVNPVGTDMSRYAFPFYPFFFTFAAVGFAKISRFFQSTAAER